MKKLLLLLSTIMLLTITFGCFEKIKNEATKGLENTQYLKDLSEEYVKEVKKKYATDSEIYLGSNKLYNHAMAGINGYLSSFSLAFSKKGSIEQLKLATEKVDSFIKYVEDILGKKETKLQGLSYSKKIETTVMLQYDIGPEFIGIISEVAKILLESGFAISNYVYSIQKDVRADLIKKIEEKKFKRWIEII